MAERPVTPSDCALAVALPLSRGELLAELESTRPSDFAREIRARFPATPLDTICAAYEDEVATSGAIVAEARALGVTVVLAAGLDALAALTARFHVVSVLAHAPSPGITAKDIIDPGAFVAAARRGTSPDQKRIRRHLRFHGVDFSAHAPAPTASTIAAILHALLWTHVAPGTRRFGQLDRTRIEDAFPAMVRPGPVLELQDGVHSLGAIRGAVACGFDGVLDLSTCTSIVLGEALKRSRDDFVVLTTRRLTRPGLRLVLYQLRMQELARARGPALFTQVVDVIARALVLAVGR
jgi:hypothetical protein